MKTIKIFLASSEELKDDREAFGNLVRRLDDIYEKRGVRLKLFEWEDYDAAYNDRRKQDEYNEKVRASDLFLAVFHTVAGKFTIEEFDVATEEFGKRGFPKSYVYCKDLKDGEVESEELKQFKKRLFDELGHYWSRYANRDTMQLHFVMQLQLVESVDNALKVEDGNVVLDGYVVACMENLPFAGLNEDFQKMKARLAELPTKIEKARAKADNYPDDEDSGTELQALLNEYNALKDEFAEYQKSLFATAKRIAQLQGERITDRMRRAMEAFNAGKVREANIILDEAERDGEIALQEYKQSKEFTEQKRQNVITSIEEILLKASTTMADNSVPIAERIDKVEQLYAQADKMATECDYEVAKYEKLLSAYAYFLFGYAKYEKAIDIYIRDIQICEDLYGKEHADTATSYNNIGLVYYNLGNYSKGLEYSFSALKIFEKVFGKEHPATASAYNNIGLVYFVSGDCSKAQEYIYKALTIREKVVGKEHPDTATLYGNVGFVCLRLGDYSKAQEYNHKALKIREKVLGEEHLHTAASYASIGDLYTFSGNYSKALEYYFKALEINEKLVGIEHICIAVLYDDIGLGYLRLGDYSKGLEYNFKALEIYEKLFGKEHPATANAYNNIGMVYVASGDYSKASESFYKALEIIEELLGKEHPHTKQVMENIATVKEAMANAAAMTTKAEPAAKGLWGKIKRKLGLK